MTKNDPVSGRRAFVTRADQALVGAGVLGLGAMLAAGAVGFHSGVMLRA